MRKLNYINVAIFTLLIACLITTEVAAIGCYSCWSNVTAECAVGPVARVEMTDCPDTDACLTAIVDEVTYRGCGASLGLPNDYPLKETCSNEYCNFNIYPADRLVCYKCQGSNCNDPRGNSRPCLNYIPNNECYTDVVNATNTVRGCLSDGNYTSTEYTTFCKDDLCNSNSSVSQVECITCSSNSTLDCVRLLNPTNSCQISVSTTCQMDVLLGRQDYCYTYQQGDYIERGCSTNFSEPDQVYSNIHYVTKCLDNKCNDECIPQSVCYTCDSANNPDCGTDLSGFSAELCSSQAISSCFTCLGEEHNITRGCGVGNQTDERVQCAVCEEEGCNNRTMNFTSSTHSDVVTPADSVTCYQCNGTDFCFDVDNTTEIVTCDEPNDKCVQYLNNAMMYRGCLSDSFGQNCSQMEEICYTCDTPNCNSLPFMSASNLTCFQCFGLTCGFAPALDFSAKCDKTFYFENNTCYTGVGSDHLIERGCSSNLRCYTHNINCTYCTGDDCNKENLVWQHCIQCSSKDDIGCTSGENLTSTICPGERQTYESSGCYVMKEDNYIVRGCLSQLNNTEFEDCTTVLDNKNCRYCMDQSCNTMKIDNGSSGIHTFAIGILFSCILIIFQGL